MRDMVAYHGQGGSSQLGRVMGAFSLGLLVAAIGVFVGQFVPVAADIPLFILELAIIIAAGMLRRRSIAKFIGYPVLVLFTFISGITISFALSYYEVALGPQLVFDALLVTTLTFAGCTAYVAISKANFKFLGGFLFSGLIALIVLMLVQFIFPLPSMLYTLYTFGGVLIFIGYTLYDLSAVVHKSWYSDNTPMMALNLYLDFVNLLLFILRLITLFTGGSGGFGSYKK